MLFDETVKFDLIKRSTGREFRHLLEDQSCYIYLKKD